MKIIFQYCSVSRRFPDISYGKLDIEGVGEQEVKAPLPEFILKQISEFYLGEYHRRMEKAKDAA